MNTIPPDKDPPHEPLENGSHLPTDEQYHARLDAEFEERGRQLKRKKRTKLLIFFVLLGAVTGGGFYWYKTNPESHQKLQGVIDEAATMKDSITKGTQAMDGRNAYEAGLQEISKHGDTVDSASAALSGNDKLEPQAPAGRTADQTTEESDGADNPESPGNQAPGRRGF